MTNAKHHCPADRRKYVLFVAILASALGFIDGSIVAVAIPQIRDNLNASFVEIQWVANAYMLFLSALMLIGGAAGDRFGIRRTFALGISMFVGASLLCGLAPDAPFLIAARALQGAGAAIMVPGSMALIARNFPKEDRGRAMGIWVAASSITTAVGPFLGGVLLNWGGNEIWRWIFLINLPLGGVSLFYLMRMVPNDVPSAGGKIDSIGAIVITLTFGLLALGLTFLGEGASSSLPVWLISAGLVVGLIALYWESVTDDPMINLKLFKTRSFSGANLMTFLVWAGLGALFFYLPSLLITGWNLTEMHAGSMFLPFSILIAVLSPFAGRLVDRLGPRPFLTIGPLISALAYSVMANGILRQDYWFGILPAIMILGVSLGTMASPLSTAVMHAVQEADTGAASGINNMIARLSHLFAIAGFGAFLAWVYANHIRSSTLPEDIQDLMIEKGYGERLTGGLYQISTVEIQAHGMSIALASLCAVLVVFCLIGALVGWMTQPHSHSKP